LKPRLFPELPSPEYSEIRLDSHVSEV
jgi:hypothetical protein